MKKVLTIIALVAASVSLVSAQEYGISWTRYAGHITLAAPTTTTITGNNAVLQTLVLNVTGTPTSLVITVQDQTAVTPKIIYKSAALSAAFTTPVVISFPIGITCNSGIDIVTSGDIGTAVLDAWASYR